MLLQSLDTQPTRQKIAAQGRSSPGKVTGKLLIALNAMVWQGMSRKDAAAHAALSEHALYTALGKVHVRQWYLHQLEVLRTSERSRNIHTLCEVRDDKSNKMARVQAVRTLEGMSEDGPASVAGRAQVAGFVIVLREGQAPHPLTIDASPALPSSDVQVDE